MEAPGSVPSVLACCSQTGLHLVVFSHRKIDAKKKKVVTASLNNSPPASRHSKYNQSCGHRHTSDSTNVSPSWIYFYIYCVNYCSVFVPGRYGAVQKLKKWVCVCTVRAVLVQKLNNNSHSKCKSKSPSTTRLLKSAVLLIHQ
jgi:hypothetical protein